MDMDSRAAARTGACQCEHVSHATGQEGHEYLAVPAGSARVAHGGPVCAQCASTHLAGRLDRQAAADPDDDLREQVLRARDRARHTDDALMAATSASLTRLFNRARPDRAVGPGRGQR